jgi:hypothetical protein
MLSSCLAGAMVRNLDQENGRMFTKSVAPAF